MSHAMLLSCACVPDADCMHLVRSVMSHMVRSERLLRLNMNVYIKYKSETQRLSV